MRYLKIAVRSILILIVIAVIAVLIMAQIQKGTVEDYKEMWESKGWEMSVKEIFPKERTVEECKPWLDSMNLESDNKNELKKFMTNKVSSLSEDIPVKLDRGESLKEFAEHSSLDEDPLWNEMSLRLDKVFAAARNCPHLQWFDPHEYKSKLWDAPSPSFNYLSTVVQFSKAAYAESMFLLAKDREQEALTELHSLYKQSSPLRMGGQRLIDSLVCIAVENLSANGFNGYQAVTNKPFSEEDLERIKSYEKMNKRWAENMLEPERMFIYENHKELPPRPEFKFLNGTFGKYLFKPFVRAYLLKSTKKDLQVITEATEFFKNKAFSDEKFAWSEAKRMFLDSEYSEIVFSPSQRLFLTDYARLLKAKAKWRAVICIDSILRYYKANEMLPDAVEDIDSEWMDDPFRNEPMKYRKSDEESFVVYSIGPDGRDQKGETLHLTGALKIEKPQDIGYRIYLRK